MCVYVCVTIISFLLLPVQYCYNPDDLANPPSLFMRENMIESSSSSEKKRKKEGDLARSDFSPLL